MKTIPKEIADQLVFKYSKEGGPHPSSVEYVPPEHPCEDCGKTITTRSVRYKRCVSPISYLSVQCEACKLFLIEETGEWVNNKDLRVHLHQKRCEMNAQKKLEKNTK